MFSLGRFVGLLLDAHFDPWAPKPTVSPSAWLLGFGECAEATSG